MPVCVASPSPSTTTARIYPQVDDDNDIKPYYSKLVQYSACVIERLFGSYVDIPVSYYITSAPFYLPESASSLGD